MRVKTIVAGAGAAAAVLPWAPPALAAGTEVEVSPGVAMPGEVVTVSGDCGRTGNEVVRVVSQALRGGPAVVDDKGRFSFPARVRRVTAQTYTVTTVCEPGGISGGSARFRVQEPRDLPRGGVAAGGGGSAARGGAAPSPGGALLLGAAVAAGIGGLVLARRRGRV